MRTIASPRSWPPIAIDRFSVLMLRAVLGRLEQVVHSSNGTPSPTPVSLTHSHSCRRAPRSPANAAQLEEAMDSNDHLRDSDQRQPRASPPPRRVDAGGPHETQRACGTLAGRRRLIAVQVALPAAPRIARTLLQIISPTAPQREPTWSITVRRTRLCSSLLTALIRGTATRVKKAETSGSVTIAPT